MVADERPLIKVEQVAKRLGVSDEWVRRAVSEGRMPSVRVGGGLRFQLSDVEAFISANRSGSARRRGGKS
jgi:excisionase family DNA binding protein